MQKPREHSRLDRAIERLTHAGGMPALRGWRGSASRKTTGGRCFALLAPRSLRPSGHLRCASSTPPGVSVVSAHICGEAAIIRDGALRLRFGTTRRSSLQLERSALARGSAIVCLGRRAAVSDLCGNAAFLSSRDAALRLNLGAPAARRPYLGFTSALPRCQHFPDCIEGNGD